MQVADFGIAKFKDQTFLSTKNVHAGINIIATTITLTHSLTRNTHTHVCPAPLLPACLPHRHACPAPLLPAPCARVPSPPAAHLPAVGTPMYMAPEQFEGLRIDEKVDIFAFGMVVRGHPAVT